MTTDNERVRSTSTPSTGPRRISTPAAKPAGSPPARPARVAGRSRFLLAMVVWAWSNPAAADPPAVRTGAAAFHDYAQQSPGVRRRITVGDLPKPYASRSRDNGPSLVPRPAQAWPQAPAGFKVELYADHLKNPRLLRTAPNGDVFLAESRADEVKILRGVDGNGRAAQIQVFAGGLHRPFGIAFYPPGPTPQWIYIANTDSVVRFPYRAGDLEARGQAQRLTDLPGGGLLRGGGHWTRDIAFARDGKKMYVSVGSRSNDDDTDGNPAERYRADILEFNPDGTGGRVFAWGIRNAVGLAVDPRTGELWASVNERDELGDDLPPDYITRVQEGGFYGWPWFYTGGHQDPRHAGKHPELKDRVLVPDVLLQPHLASLEMVFYDGTQFPAEYRGDIFAAEHGSWNRGKRTGYEVIRVLRHQRDQASGAYEDFLTGFVTAEGNVWGRPVGVAVGADGSLLVSDDGGNCVWRVRYPR